MDFRLRPCPDELAQFPSSSISPEVGQIVQEAFAKRRWIAYECIRARAIELGATSDDVPSIFKEGQAPVPNVVGLARRNARRKIKQTKGREQNGPKRARAMPGSFAVDSSSDSDAESDTRSFDEGVTESLDIDGSMASEGDVAEVSTATDMIEYGKRQTRKENRDYNSVDSLCHSPGSETRHLSDNSFSSTVLSNPFSPAGTASSRTSNELPSPKNERPLEQVGNERQSKGGPRSWIKNTVGRASQPAKQEIAECLACATEFPSKRLVVLDCPEKHAYCHSCFELLVQHSCENEASFPPQCCQVPVREGLIKKHVTRKTQKKFEGWSKIARIPPDERWYCPYPRCAKVMNSRSLAMTSKGARCVYCRKYICVSCKQAAHLKNSECQDGALKATLLTGRDKGWQACYRCGEMVELKDGCRHVTCRCRAEFCYICTRRWGNCVDGHTCMQTLEDMRKAAPRRTDEDGEDRDPIREFVRENAELTRQRQQQQRQRRQQRQQQRQSSLVVTNPNQPDLTNLTEEEQIAFVMSQSLRESEEAEMRKMIEEVESAAAAIAAVEPLQQTLEMEMEQALMARLTTIIGRFNSYEAELRRIQSFQRGLIFERHQREHCTDTGVWRADAQWLDRMHAERLSILAQDKELLVEDPGFSLHDYRRTARAEQTN